jgi:hypothetical protein
MRRQRAVFQKINILHGEDRLLHFFTLPWFVQYIEYRTLIAFFSPERTGFLTKKIFFLKKRCGHQKQRRICLIHSKNYANLSVWEPTLNNILMFLKLYFPEYKWLKWLILVTFGGN